MSNNIKTILRFLFVFITLFNKPLFGQTPSIDWGEVQDEKKVPMIWPLCIVMKQAFICWKDIPN